MKKVKKTVIIVTHDQGIIEDEPYVVKMLRHFVPSKCLAPLTFYAVRKFDKPARSLKATKMNFMEQTNR